MRKHFCTNPKRLSFIAIGAVAAVTFVSGCGREEIKVYSVAKENKGATPMMAAINSDNPEVPVNAAPVTWKTPAGWKELAPTSIRLGNFSITTKAGKKAEVAITSFPGSVGSELDNWNRWRREVGLKDSTADQMTSEKVQIGEEEGKLYAVPGSTSEILVAVLREEEATWFFKLVGDKEAVKDSRSDFIEFLKSIELTEGQVAGNPHGSTKTAPGTDPHAGLNLKEDPHANVPGFKEQAQAEANASEDDAAESDLPKWNVPANWKEKPAGMMVTKSFAVTDDKGTATVAISVFPGDVGGNFANVNRWRGQLGLPPIKQDEMAKETTAVDVEGGKATFVDLKGTDAKTGKPARMVAAIVPQGESTWFYKLTGDDAVVGKEKEAFTKFVQTVRY